MAQELRGKAVADAIKEDLSQRISALKTRGLIAKLGLLRVGDRPEDLYYEQEIQRSCSALGISLEIFPFPQDITTAELENRLQLISADKHINGILLLAPLPKHLDDKKIRAQIPPEKDVDCLNPHSAGKVFSDDPDGFPPCTPIACMEILKYYSIPLQGKRAVVIGRSLVVGKPLAMLLLRENATVTICHSRTENLPQICREADLVLAALGQARMIDQNYLKPGQIIIDVGTNPDPDRPGKYCGDVDFAAAENTAAWITPVPGGVGSITTAVLCKHTILACERQNA